MKPYKAIRFLFVNCIAAHLCINISQAQEEIGRCFRVYESPEAMSRAYGPCIFAWRLYEKGGAYVLDTTAGPTTHVLLKNNRLWRAAGPFHNGLGAQPEWLIHSHQEDGRWYIAAYGIPYETDDAFCQAKTVENNEDSDFKEGCWTYNYYTDGDKRSGYISKNGIPSGGPILPRGGHISTAVTLAVPQTAKVFNQPSNSEENTQRSSETIETKK